MDRCNVTGVTEGLFDFYIDADFGFNAKFSLEAEHFSFNLCKFEFDSFMKKGVSEIDESNKDDYTYQYNRWFTSEQIYDLISTFKYVPNGYYRNNFSTFTDEEEQLFWDNMDKSKRELLTPERAEELEYVLYGDQ